MADSPPSASMCFRYHPLGKFGGSALTPPPTKTEARPSSWSQVFWRLAPTSLILSSFMRKRPSGAVLPPAGPRNPGTFWTWRGPRERLDPEATHSPSGVLACCTCLHAEMGRPISGLGFVSCWSFGGTRGVGSTLASSGEPHVPLL